VPESVQIGAGEGDEQRPVRVSSTKRFYRVGAAICVERDRDVRRFIPVLVRNDHLMAELA
jgi:hypothetical protein